MKSLIIISQNMQKTNETNEFCHYSHRKHAKGQRNQRVLYFYSPKTDKRPTTPNTSLHMFTQNKQNTNDTNGFYLIRFQKAIKRPTKPTKSQISLQIWADPRCSSWCISFLQHFFTDFIVSLICCIISVGIIKEFVDFACLPNVFI